ncbi:nuclear transport factor 2 family protein [Caulobacter soli]|uniref:nuclear transport factor 2 family protein n=1 Tax=Caulobacter soli TaxID=2708539 RepID=UPI0013EAA5D5|nr:nuclear transport factor 2 family protein [Caulobacter soli]
MSAATDVIVRYYDALAHRDIEAVMTLMHPDAEFGDFLEGGDVIGSTAVRAFFQYMFDTLAPDFDLLAMTVEPDGRIRADMQVATHDRQGHIWSDTRSYALYTVVDGLIHGIELQAAI